MDVHKSQAPQWVTVKWEGAGHSGTVCNPGIRGSRPAWATYSEFKGSLDYHIMEFTQFDTLWPKFILLLVTQRYNMASGIRLQVLEHTGKRLANVVIVEVWYLKQGGDILVYLLQLYVWKCGTLIIPVLINWIGNQPGHSKRRSINQSILWLGSQSLTSVPKQGQWETVRWGGEDPHRSASPPPPYLDTGRRVTQN